MKEEGAEPSGQRRSSFELWGRVGVSMGLECPWGARGWWGRAMVSISRSRRATCAQQRCRHSTARPWVSASKPSSGGNRRGGRVPKMEARKKPVLRPASIITVIRLG